MSQLRYRTSDVTDFRVCQAYAAMAAGREAGGRGQFASDILKLWFPAIPMKVIERAMVRAHRRDLLEYGVSLRSGWLTQEGKDLLDSGEDNL